MCFSVVFPGSYLWRAIGSNRIEPNSVARVCLVFEDKLQELQERHFVLRVLLMFESVCQGSQHLSFDPPNFVRICCWLVINSTTVQTPSLVIVPILQRMIQVSLEMRPGRWPSQHLLCVNHQPCKFDVMAIGQPRTRGRRYWLPIQLTMKRT